MLCEGHSHMLIHVAEWYSLDHCEENDDYHY
jgi:hypothetical protein